MVKQERQWVCALTLEPVSPSYRNWCRPGTRAASKKCKTGTGATFKPFPWSCQHSVWRRVHSVNILRPWPGVALRGLEWPNKKPRKHGASLMSRAGVEPATIGLKVQTRETLALGDPVAFSETPAHGPRRDLPGLQCALPVDPACTFGVHHRPPAPRFDYHPPPITIC